MENFAMFPYGVTSERGNRPTQQDDFLIIQNPFGDNLHTLFAVLDGHGEQGDKVCKAVKKYITELVERRRQSFINNSELALIELFRDVNEALDDDVSLDVYLSGTTIVLALVSLTKITIANLGDCRAIIVKEDASSEFSYNCLTRDHTCMNEVEVERIRAAGARVEKTGSPPLPEDAPLRIFKGSLPYPGLVMTRTLGDSAARKLGVTYEPEITTYNVEPTDLCLVLATDGVWDALENDKVAKIASIAKKNVQKASNILAEKSLKYLGKKFIDDNTTNLIVSLKTNS